MMSGSCQTLSKISICSINKTHVILVAKTHQFEGQSQQNHIWAFLSPPNPSIQMAYKGHSSSEKNVILYQ